MSRADYASLARSLGADDRPAARAALARVAGDATFADTVRRHHLSHLLFATLPEDELRAALPPPAFDALREWLRRPRSSPADDVRAIDEVQTALRRHGIDCMVLKGLYFAHRLYRGLERRAQYDVDLVTRRRDFTRASRVLADLGFVERWRDLHSVTWRRGADNLDLHSCFRNVPAYRLDEDRIWRDRVSYTIGDLSFTTPSDEDTLVLLVLSLFQDIGLGSAKLKQLVDVVLLVAAIDRSFDWGRFFARRAPEKTLPVAVNVLDFAVRVFDVATSVPRLAATLAGHADVLAVREREQALALLFAERSAPANKAWFFRIYPGSVARYWLWLLPRKLPLYLKGQAPGRGPSSMRPSLATLRLLLGAPWRDPPPPRRVE